MDRTLQRIADLYLSYRRSTKTPTQEAALRYIMGMSRGTLNPRMIKEYIEGWTKGYINPMPSLSAAFQTGMVAGLEARQEQNAAEEKPSEPLPPMPPPILKAEWEMEELPPVTSADDLTQDKLDRYWKHFEDEVDLGRASEILEGLGEGHNLLEDDDVQIVMRALAVAVSETLHRKATRDTLEGL